jgi:tetratricopeptide (TPR) repeat protein
MTAKQDMRGRLFGLAVGLLLLAEAFALWQPQALGGLPQPDLGPFSQYRLVIALLSAGAGAVVMLASMFRDTGASAPSAKPPAAPLSLDLGAPPAAADHATLHAEPVAADPPHPLAPTPELAPATAHGHVEDIEELDPFPGTAHAHPPPPPPAEAEEHADEEPPPEPPASGGDDRGRFLALSHEGHRLRNDSQLDDAYERYSDALDLARRRTRAHPGNVMARRDLAAALTNLGDLHEQENHLDQAITLHEESLGVRQRLADEAPNDLVALRGLSTGLERLAEARDARGHRSRARDLFRLRLALDQRMSAMAPGDPEFLALAAVTRERLRELDEALAL